MDCEITRVSPADVNGFSDGEFVPTPSKLTCGFPHLRSEVDAVKLATFPFEDMMRVLLRKNKGGPQVEAVPFVRM